MKAIITLTIGGTVQVTINHGTRTEQSPRTDPTDRSNSPAIINSVTGIANIAISEVTTRIDVIDSRVRK